MGTKKLAYDRQQIAHIKKILTRNYGTIEYMVQHSQAPQPQELMISTLETCKAEITTCINMLESEYTYVSGM